MPLFSRILVFFTLISALFSFTSCRKSTSANWDVDAVVPVINSTLNITNFAGDTLFSADNTGLLHISLKREIASLKLDSLLNLPDTTLEKSFINPGPFSPTFAPGQTIPIAQTSDLEFDIPGGAALKRVDVRTGSITVKFSNSVPEPLQLSYRLPGAMKNGVPFTIIETIPTGTNSLIKSYDLSGYSLNMRGSLGNKYNQVAQAYTLAVSQQASDTVMVEVNKGANIELTYSKVIPDYVEGYFGQQKIDIKLDTANFTLTENFKASNFMLSEASMEFNILNEFGTEFRANLYNTKSINTMDNRQIALNTDQLSDIHINRASRAGSTIYPSVKSFSFRSDNSNILPFISNLPDKITYQGDIEVNPLGNIWGYNDFAYYNKGIRILANINIPLKFSADYFLLSSKPKSVDFSNVKQLDNVNYGNFVIIAKNGFPFSTKLQGYLYDAENHLLDSLFDTSVNNNIIGNGELNALNEVIAPRQSKIYIPINKQKIDNLKKCRFIKVESKFIMPPNPPDIKILETYEIYVNVVAELNYQVGLANN